MASITDSAWPGIGMLSGFAHLLVGPRELFCRPLDWTSVRPDMRSKWGMKMYQLITLGFGPVDSSLLRPDSQKHVPDWRGLMMHSRFPLMTVLLTLLFVYVAMSLIKAGKGRRRKAPRPHGGPGDLHGNQCDFLGVL